MSERNNLGFFCLVMFIPVSLFLAGIASGNMGGAVIYLFVGLAIWWWLGGWMDKSDAPSKEATPIVQNTAAGQKCVWCGDLFKEGEKKLGDCYTQYGIEKVGFDSPAEYFSICGYCHEGLLSIRARGGDDAVVHAVLREAKKRPDIKRGRGYNDFIHAANQVSNSL